MQLTAFVRGLWFDNVIACYVLIVPLAVLCVSALFNYYGKKLFRFIVYYFGVLYGIVFLTAAANIPYFAYFTKLLNSSIFNWFEYGATTTSMVTGESSYYLYIACFLIAVVLFGYLIHLYHNRLRRALESDRTPEGWKERGIQLVISACLIGLCLFGIRGRMGYNPCLLYTSPSPRDS